MRTAEEIKEYKACWKRYYSKLSKENKPNQYKVTNGSEVKYFKNRWDLAAFLGYAPDYITNCIKAKKSLCGYTIEKIKWWKELKNV